MLRNRKNDASGDAPPRKRGTAERWVFFTCAAFSVLAVAGIIAFIFVSSLPAFAEIGVFNFLFGSTWAPQLAGAEPSEIYGILPMIVGSLCVTAGALLLGGTLGIFTALFLVYWCPKRLKKPFEQVVNIFAGIPSIIFGFFGLEIIVPAINAVFPDNFSSGKGILACSLVLMIMVLPTIAGLSKNALKSVPQSYYEGAVALGATEEQAVFTVMLPAARSGIVSSLILGCGRAIGETMAITLVAGNRALFPDGLVSNISTLTTLIAQEYGDASGLKQNALIATGFVLLVIILILNFAISLIKRTSGGGRSKRRLNGDFDRRPVYKRKGWITKALRFVSVALSCFVVFTLVGLVIYILVNALPSLNLHFLFGKSTNRDPTLTVAFASTGMIIALALLIAVPIGIGAAIYLNEYAKPGSKIVGVIRLFTDTLSGIPSIVFGLFGNILFVGYLGMGYSLLAGGLTMALMILPTVVRSVEESLIAVPDALREASLALGASKFRTVMKVVLPQALAGILTAAVLSIGRIVGESAALIYTSGSTTLMPGGYLGSGSTFAVLMYVFSVESLEGDEYKPYLTAFVLLIFVAIIYVALGLIEHFLGGDKKWKRSEKKDRLKLKTA